MKNNDFPPLRITTDNGQQMDVVNYPALFELNADVYLIFGMRSFGKSYGILSRCLKQWIDTKESFVMMRTIDDDIMQTKARKYIAGVAGRFAEWTDYEKELTVYGSDFIARSIGENKTIVREKVGSVMSLSGWLKYKGNNYDDVTTIIFEEFLERRPKLTDEAFLEGYLNNLSTVIRLRQNVKVFCLANTVKKKSPLFDYYHIDLKRIKKGQPALFTEENGLRVCVYWTPDVKLENDSSKHYTVSSTKQAKMITGGEWETEDYATTWLNYKWSDCAKLKRFRLSYKIFIDDLKIHIWMPYVSNTPILILHQWNTRTVPKRRMMLIELYLFYPNYYKQIIKAILSKNIVTDGKCNDEIDALIEKANV